MTRTFAPSLQALFVMLRTADIAVGIEEIARLATIFKLTPVLDRQGLRRVLCGVVVKSTEQRADFERIFAKWLATLDGELARIEPLLAAESARRSDGHESERRASKATRNVANPYQALEFSASAAQQRAGRESGAERARTGAGDSDDDLFGTPDQPGLILFGAPDQPGLIPGTEPPEPRMQPASESRYTSQPTGHPSIIQGQISHGTRGNGRRLLTLIMLLVTLGIAVWVLFIGGDGQSDKKTHNPIMSDAGPQGDSPDAGPMMAESKDRALTPQLRIERAPTPESNLLGYIIAPLALALVFWLWARFGSGAWLPTASRQTASDDDELRARRGRGPPRRRSLETLILDERDEEELIWGVGRFVSEERSRDLDINRSVRDTASAYGRPVLHYQGSECQREVWLWIDESLDSPVARQLADDLSLMLQKSGLPVTKATFWGIPERLRSERDEAMTLDAFDARRDSAAVAILTDGRMLSLAHRARNRRGDIENLMRNLSYWPRITFIDFGSDRLTSLCQRHHLRVIKPQDAACAISELTEAYERPIEYDGLVGDARVWLAACALSPRALSERLALALRRELALDVSPWQIERIRTHARDDAGRLGFSVVQRAAHLAWLIEAEDVPTRSDRLPENSLVRRIVKAWDRVLDERARVLARAAEKRGRVWLGCAEERALAVERECIRLWAHPDRAAIRLYGLYRADEYGSADAIRGHLANLAGRERLGGEQTIALPWSVAHMRRSTRVMLHDMGLASAGAAPARDSMPAPGHIWLALGLCAGLFGGALTALLEQWTPPPKPLPTFVDEGASGNRAPRNAFQRIDDANLIAEVAMPGRPPVQKSVKRGDKVRVRWDTEELACETMVGKARLIRCPRGVEGDQRENWSFAILAVDYSRQASSIAEELLVSGSVDGVYLAKSADMSDVPIAQLARPVQTGTRDQLLVVAPRAPSNIGEYRGDYVVIGADQVGLLSGVTDGFDEWRTLSRANQRLEAIAGSTDHFRVRGTGPCGQRGQRCCVEPEESCDGVLHCQDQVCVEPECTLPGSHCEGDVAITCTEDLTVERRQCQASEYCDLGTCLARRCRPDELKCSARGTHYQSCLSGGRSWSEQRACARGSACMSAADGCQPIVGAMVQFTAIRHRKRGKKASIKYRLRCGVVHSQDGEVLDMKMATGDQTVLLKNRPRARVLYAKSPKQVIVECMMSDARVGITGQTPTNKASIGVDKPRLNIDRQRKRHSWLPGIEKKHRLMLGNFGGRNAIAVEYRIKLMMASGKNSGKPGTKLTPLNAQPGNSQ